MNQEFLNAIFSVIYQIPQGKVTSYGQVAKLAGYPGYARHVGKALGNLPSDSQLPWFRVLNSQGKISLTGNSFERQKQRLEQENITVSEAGRVNLKTYRWEE